jgi:hypothetical protein
MGKFFDVTITDQSVIDPAELLGHSSDAIFYDGMFGYHTVLLLFELQG